LRKGLAAYLRTFFKRVAREALTEHIGDKHVTTVQSLLATSRVDEELLTGLCNNGVAQAVNSAADSEKHNAVYSRRERVTRRSNHR
jgi:hypothetical protein